MEFANDRPKLRIKKTNGTELTLILNKEELFKLLEFELRKLCKVPDDYESQVRLRYSAGTVDSVEFQARSSPDIEDNIVAINEIQLITAEAFAHHYLDQPR